MRRHPWLSIMALAALLPGQHRPDVEGPTPASGARLLAELEVSRRGCIRCHDAGAAAAARLAPAAGPALAAIAGWQRQDGGERLLRQHHGGDAAADLAAYIGSLAVSPAPAAVLVTAARIEAGERRFGELACGACHASDAFASLPARVDATTLTAFLQSPTEHRPGVAHPRLDADAAAELTAWLLRQQHQVVASHPGFAWTCFEQRIRRASRPDLGAIEPVASGRSMVIDASPGSREHHFVLRFQATLDVPRSGEWTFTTDSDDSSWLWIDEALVVANEGLAPRRSAEGSVTLTAGPHALRVEYTQAAGEASLEVLWRGPGTPEQPLPGDRASTAAERLEPPPPRAPADTAAVDRGRRAARALRCDACHRVEDPAFLALPSPEPGRPLARLEVRDCPHAADAGPLAARVQASLPEPRSAVEELSLAMAADGCLRCHARDGRGGLTPAVRTQLAEVEDLGDEGRLPPDLSAVGARLRSTWIERVLAGERRARPYLRAAMPILSADRARAYAEWFAAVDAPARGSPAAEPEFSPALAARGHELAGTSGKNCVTCHGFQGTRALGPNGMDMDLMFERTQPTWFRDWLLTPHRLRPGTRMPALWPVLDDAARADADALRVWLSLGSASPRPIGLPQPGALVLQPTDRPLLHGAFLRGVSARCLCVGTPERTHFAYDLAAPALVWLWRGDFVDADGTWSGRAGKLLQPKGKDHVTLREPQLADGRVRTLRGQRRDPDGYPVLMVAVDGAAYEDCARPRLGADGSVIVRTLRCTEGALEFVFLASEGVSMSVAGEPAARHGLVAGQQLEVVYRW